MSTMTREQMLLHYQEGGRRFYNIDLHNQCLRKLDLSTADFQGADLSEADLSNTNLRFTNLNWANLRGANLRGANLSEATLYKADLTGALLPHFQIVPEMGSFTAFKKLMHDVVCELLIPADSPRTSALCGRKCRAAFAEVVAIYTRGGIELDVGYSLWDRTEYQVGQVVVADSYDDDIRVECTHGIHFFITLEEARNY